MRTLRSQSAGKGKIVLLLGAAMLLLVVAGGAVLGPRLLGARKAAAKAGKASEAAAAAKPPPPQVVPLGDFLVNLRSMSGLRYLRAEISISLTGLKAAGEGGHGEGGAKKSLLPEGDLALSRDRVVAALSAAVFEEIRMPGGREALRQEIQASLQRAMPQYQVGEVLFTSFVMQ
jgi:flagellar basal body-associated protein FliL